MADPDLHESHVLIASDKVVGTTVYDMSGEHIGSIERIILEKRGGRVSYAVMSFGGFLGMGHDHYPLPWDMLHYNEDPDGFQVDITKDQVEGRLGTRARTMTGARKMAGASMITTASIHPGFS